MKAATLTTQSYAPDTRLDLTVTMDVAYSLTGKKAVFEVVSLTNEVLFRYSSGVDGQLSITGQVVTLAIDPLTESEDALGNTLLTAMTAGSNQNNVDFNLDFQPVASTVVDYRIQGDFDILPTHGPIE